MSVQAPGSCGAGISPLIESVVGTTSLIRLVALNPDGTPMDLTGAVVEMRVGSAPSQVAAATYSTTAGTITLPVPTTSGVFVVRTSPTVDALAGFSRYVLTVTPSGGVATVLAHGPYAVAVP